MTDFGPKELKNALKVIKAAKKLGVISMKIGNLEFELAESINNLAPRRAFKSTKKSAEKIETDQLQLDFDSAKESIGIMHAEDPLAFEQSLADDELIGPDGGEGEIGEEALSS